MKLRRGFSDAELIEGGADVQRHAQAELNRGRRVRVAMTSNKPELPRSDLAPALLGLLEHKPSGEFFTVSRSEQTGEEHDTFAAFFIDGQGDPVFLERPSGPKSRAEHSDGGFQGHIVPTRNLVSKERVDPSRPARRTTDA